MIRINLERLPIAVLILIASAIAEPPPSNLIANVYGRAATSLDGSWNTIVDPYQIGVSCRIFLRNAKPRDKHDLLEYSFRCVAETRSPRRTGIRSANRFSFTRAPSGISDIFSHVQRPRTRLFLYFGAANYSSRVWLNGEKVGEHTGGFTAFNFEVTGIVADGENSLVVEVSNVRQTDGVPALNTDWWNYGGLTRSVQLIEVPATFIQDYSVQLAKGSHDEIAAWVQLNHAAENAPVTIEIPEAHIKRTVTADANGRAEFDFSREAAIVVPAGSQAV